MVSGDPEAGRETPPKIIVDESWKDQVERERETLRRQETTSDQFASSPPEPAVGEQAAPATEPTAADTPRAQPTAEERRRRAPMPPATLEVLVTTLASQAMMALQGMGDDSPPDPDIAKHLIDTLAMLEDKTEGRRTPDETRLLAGILHELRMAFVMTRR